MNRPDLPSPPLPHPHPWLWPAGKSSGAKAEWALAGQAARVARLLWMTGDLLWD